MSSFAGDLIHAEFINARAMEGLILNILDGRKGCCSGNHFIDRSGNVSCLGKPVHIYAVIETGGIPCNVRNIVRVKVGGGYGAKYFTGLIIINGHSSLSSRHGFQSNLLNLSRQG